MNQKEAKKILPKKEYEAFESIFMNQVSRASGARLKQRATMARRLRDKYRDLGHHEAAGVRTRRTNEVDTDINDRRARLFQDVITFLEDTLEHPRFSKPAGQTPARKKANAKVASNVRDERKDEKVARTARYRSRPTAQNRNAE